MSYMGGSVNSRQTMTFSALDGVCSSCCGFGDDVAFPAMSDHLQHWMAFAALDGICSIEWHLQAGFGIFSSCCGFGDDVAFPARHDRWMAFAALQHWMAFAALDGICSIEWHLQAGFGIFSSCCGFGDDVAFPARHDRFQRWMAFAALDGMHSIEWHLQHRMALRLSGGAGKGRVFRRWRWCGDGRVAGGGSGAVRRSYGRVGGVRGAGGGAGGEAGEFGGFQQDLTWMQGFYLQIPDRICGGRDSTCMAQVNYR